MSILASVVVTRRILETKYDASKWNFIHYVETVGTSNNKREQLVNLPYLDMTNQSN